MSFQTASELTSTIKDKSASTTKRVKAIEDLGYMLDPQNRTANLDPIKDRGYRDILETFFNFVLEQKHVFYGATKSKAPQAGPRLEKCADAVKKTVSRCLFKLGTKSVLSIVAHITEILHRSNGGYVEPLVSGYVKTLAILLSRNACVELLVRKEDGIYWDSCVDLVLGLASYYLPEHQSNVANRASPAPGTGTMRVSGKSTASTQSQKLSSQGENDAMGRLRSTFEALLDLLKVGNAPVMRRSQEVVELTVRTLNARSFSLGTLQSTCFSIINTVFPVYQTEAFEEAISLVHDLVPLMNFWWRAEKVSQDELIRSLRNEILRSIFLVQHHLEYIALRQDDAAFPIMLEELAQPLWREYSKRGETFRLQMQDITFSVSDLAPSHLQNSLFGLRPHNIEGESYWALVQNLATLESLLSKRKHAGSTRDSDDDDKPRKRLKTSVQTSRLRSQLRSRDIGIRRTALQVIPFVVGSGSLTDPEITDLLEELLILGTDKDAIIASWALVACASCGLRQNVVQDQQATWRYVWHMAVRLVSLPPTSRAACVVLSTILTGNFLPYHEISEHINHIVTTADVSGPAVLSDASLALMLQLFHVRNVRLPSASQATSGHIIRWVFLRWIPGELGYASSHSLHSQTGQFVNLLRACCGEGPVSFGQPLASVGGRLSETWMAQQSMTPFIRYLLLLDEGDDQAKNKATIAPPEQAQRSETGSFHPSRKLVLELLTPRLEDLNELCTAWTKKASDGGVQISLEKFQSLLAAVMVGSALLPQISDLNSTQSATVGSTILGLAEKSLNVAMESIEPQVFIEATLRLVRPCIPKLKSETISDYYVHHRGLLSLLAKIYDLLYKRQATDKFMSNVDLMEIDEEFESQDSGTADASTQSVVPRCIEELRLDSASYYVDTKYRLQLLNIVENDEGQIGVLPDGLVDTLLAASDEELLMSSNFILEAFRSNLTLGADTARDVVHRLGDIVARLEYQSSEVALSTCIDVIDGCHDIWLQSSGDLRQSIGDMYNHFVVVSLRMNGFSPAGYISMVGLLLTLLRAEPDYATNAGLESCRTSLLYILANAPLKAKCFIADHIADVFGLYILKLHDEIFIDVLNNLPSNSQNIAGIAFRLQVLSRLACRWPTLLRRCTYHIFETPGKITSSLKHASICLRDIAQQLALASPAELFRLFSRQLLYTWLDSELIEDIPYDIFGYSNLPELLCDAQGEALGLMVMRGQVDMSKELARHVRKFEADLVKSNFHTALAYSMIYGDSSGGDDQGLGEGLIERAIGKKGMAEARYESFADIVALFIDVIDQDNLIEKTFLKHEDFAYAGKIMAKIKSLSHSSASLPPNQQPTFRARFLPFEIQRLCESTIFDFREIWTPPLVLSVSRKLLNTVHPALGSLHACSVIRKVRILVCLAGPVALDSYVIEMLLSSMRPFLVDSECADDALGVSQYLLSEGSAYLRLVPSFLAGYALSTLASLRVFLESSQASTTQEEQFKATMSRAKAFHSWFADYLGKYESNAFDGSDQRKGFYAITSAAASIRSSGNAEKGTSESKLLLEILRDGRSTSQLLNEASRRSAIAILSNDFAFPAQRNRDVINADEEAIALSTPVWKSSQTSTLSDSYLAWAGRAVGRSFSASGNIPLDVIRETRLTEYRRLSQELESSEMGILTLLQQLASSSVSATAGLAEAALRNTISQAIQQEDESLLVACQMCLREPLFLASQWGNYRSPPSEMKKTQDPRNELIWTLDIASPTWAQELSVYLCQSATNSILMPNLIPIFSTVKGFAEEAFPFLLHLVLYLQLDQQQSVRKAFSSSMKQWLNDHHPDAISNQTLLLNSILYLRTQPYPKESSMADRSYWLDVDLSQAASVACACGMYRSALLLVESIPPDTGRASRRSSAAAAENTGINDTLLKIFENIDDPDAYYGLPEEPSLAKVLSRVEYESEGTKSLAFRGAQYDTHLRQRDAMANDDAQHIVNALNTLGLAGLSHSVLQTLQSSGAAPSSLRNTFTTAQRLESWNLPAPTQSDHSAVVVYKAYQAMYQAVGPQVVRCTIYEGFERTMRALATSGARAAHIRKHLSALAVLTELDDVMNVSDSTEFDFMLRQFQDRREWMKSGLYEDVSQILSCRGTTMSMMSQHTNLLQNAKISVADFRAMQVKSLLVSASIYRDYRAKQESTNVATTLMSLIPICAEQGLQVDAAIKMEVANSLWDHGEMSTSIRMLQGIDQDASLKSQSVTVSRSDLLSKIGHHVSVARLEKPGDIQKNYLEPALKELKGLTDGPSAGTVYHQFALFCDGQLQDPAGLEDLARLQSLRQAKSDEVAGLQSLVSSTRDSQLKNRYNHVLSKEKQWLHLDEQELRRVEQTRSEFVRLSLENYLLSLMASDEHNNDALRFIALWLERSAEDKTNKAVSKFLEQVPTRKFAALMNQLSSRLQSTDSMFQKLLSDLVYRICIDHPYHGMYQVWSGTKVKTNTKDEVAMQRWKANERVAQRIGTNESAAGVWLAIDKTSKYYHLLAMDKNATKYKPGAKINLKDSPAAQNLINALNKYRIPPPTMHMELSPTMDYSNVPIIAKLEPQMTIASGVSAPKIITAVGTNGVRYKQLVKGGHDDLRQDAIMEQVFAAVSSLLKLHRATQQRNLQVRTYKVLPLTASSGLIEFVPNTIPLHEFLMPAHERYYPKDYKGNQCRREIYGVQGNRTESRIATYRKVTERFHPVMRYFFMEHFLDPDDWFAKRLAYTRTTAAISMLGHILGLGDRHGHNILLDTKSGEVVHIDLGVAFEAGRILPVPEMVPFRLTRDIVDGMGITKTEGVFRRCCEFTLDALREEQYSIMTILDVLRYDPLYTWTISPLRLAKLQKSRHNEDASVDETQPSETDDRKRGKAGGDVNEPTEADRALEVVRKKLSKTLSVTATVNDLINQAMDEGNLAVLYSGWAAYA